MSIQNQVMIAAKMYEARDAARGLLGDKYYERVGEARRAIRGLADKHKTTILNAAMNCVKRVLDDGDGYTAMLVLAAAVEEIESGAA